jgi:hypothetical protein
MQGRMSFRPSESYAQAKPKEAASADMPSAFLMSLPHNVLIYPSIIETLIFSSFRRYSHLTAHAFSIFMEGIRTVITIRGKK